MAMYSVESRRGYPMVHYFSSSRRILNSAFCHAAWPIRCSNDIIIIIDIILRYDDVQSKYQYPVVGNIYNL